MGTKRGSEGGGLESATAPCPAPPGRDAVDSIRASLAGGRAWLGTRAGPSPALGAYTCEKNSALSSQDFLELALSVLGESEVQEAAVALGWG